MSLYDLLPPNSTALERDFSRAISSLPKLQTAAPTIRTAKRRNIPPTVLPWLVYEYGLGELTPYFQDLSELLIEGIAWQRIRGTPASIQQALGWLGLNGTIDESEAGSYRWSEYQIGLPAAIDDQRTRDVIYLAGLATPVRSRLNRVFAVYDERRFVLDDSALSGGAMLSDHSGTRPAWANGTQISFGRVFGGEIDGGATSSGGVSRERHNRVVLLDRFILDYSILGGTADEDAWHTLNPDTLRERQYGVEVRLVEDPRGWAAEAWGEFVWSPPIMGITGGHWQETRLWARFVTADGQFILGPGILGGNDDQPAWHAPNPAMGHERET